MKTNMGNADRIIRILLAAIFAGLYFTGVVTDTIASTLLWIVGIIFIMTSAIGFCPLYAVAGFNTLGKKR